MFSWICSFVRTADSNRLFRLSDLKKRKNSDLSHAVILILGGTVSVYNRDGHFWLLKWAEEFLVQNLYSVQGLTTILNTWKYFIHWLWYCQVILTQLCKFKFLQVLSIQLFFISVILSLRHNEFKTCALLWFYPSHTEYI